MVLYKGPYKLSYRNLSGTGIKKEETDKGPQSYEDVTTWLKFGSTCGQSFFVYIHVI